MKFWIICMAKAIKRWLTMKLLAGAVAILLCSTAIADRPLPVVGCWNTGENQLADGEDRGYCPDYQLSRLQVGKPWQVAFEWYDNFRPNERALRPWYYEPAWSHCRDNKLPIAFVGRNFADLFRLNPPWSGAIPADHPFRINADGSITKAASPWSPNIHQWYALGRKVGGYLAAEFAADYPDPPSVILMDNAEVGADRRVDARMDSRYPQLLRDAFAKLSPSQAAEIERHVYGQAMAFRFGELKRGLRDALPEGWKRIKFVAYGQFGSDYASAEVLTDSLRYGVPWSDAAGDGVFQTHDGRTANVGYLHNWSTGMPGIVRSPSIEAGNSRFALDTMQASFNRDYLIETHFANGKNVSRDVWAGVVRCVMWQMRTEHNRLFVGSSLKVADTATRDMEPLESAAAEVHENETLRRFWGRSTLLPNRWARDFATMPKRHQYDTDTGYGHPYTWMLPPEFADTGRRLFVQHVPLNERLQLQYTDTAYPRYVDRWLRDRTHLVAVPVFAICLQLGDEYLVYAHAPNGAVSGAEIHVCPDGNVPRFRVTVDVPVAGAFWLRDQSGHLSAVQ